MLYLRMGSALTLLSSVAVWLLLQAAVADAQWSSIAPGVELLERTDPGPRRVRALRIDLCRSGVSMRATTYGERGKVTSTWGSAVGVAAAVNGGYFLSGYRQDGGFAVGNGQAWPGATDTNYRGYIAFGTPFGVGNSHVSPAHLVEGGAPAPWIGELVNGDAHLVAGGVPVNCPSAGCVARHPRTAAGFTKDKRTVLLAVVDGRSGSSIGMTINEMGALMKNLGAHEAINLDGGGSSTLWTKSGGVRNRPSDGGQRTVANHLGVFARGSGHTPHCPTGFRAKYVASGFPGGKPRFEVPIGSTVSGYMEFQNTGTETWTAATRMGTQKPQDGASPVATGDWLSPSRIQLSNPPVKTGETGRFNFSVKSHGPVGTVTRQQFNLVQEAVTWFHNSWGPPANQMAFEVVTVEPRPEEPRPEEPTTPDTSTPDPASPDANVAQPPEQDASSMRADASNSVTAEPDAQIHLGSGTDGLEGSCSASRRSVPSTLPALALLGLCLLRRRQ